MTQEEKDLLLQDICSRLPYGVKVEYENEIFDVEYVSPMYEEVKLDIPETWTISVSEVKPYLFPLSSITKEQWKEISDIQIKESLKSIDSNNDYMSNPLFSIGDLKVLDWCYANHIDYRGLIPMGLAIDATGLNIY